MRRHIRVALVGATPTGAENLSLGYVAKALAEEGHEASLFTYRGIETLDLTARQAVGARPDLIGVTIPSGDSAIDAIAFVHRVRQLGFAGHVTCGGTYATLSKAALLESHAVIDSVIRHDGELPVVALAAALASGAPLDRLPGVTTRSGDGLPAPVGDPAALQTIPARPFLKRYAGVLSAKISAVRGCFGSCAYCGLYALRREAKAEGARCGMDRETMDALGVGGVRRRSIDAVADEMADLYRTGVRFFHFVDENHLPRDPDEAQAVIAALDQALEARGVGRRAVNMMLRADVATPSVVASLRGLGLSRCLLGVESMQAEGLRALGRAGAGETNLAAMQALQDAGVMFHFNILLIHPDATIDAIRSEVAALRQVRGGLIDPFQAEVYQGTTLFRRLERQGRLRGGPLLYHYWPEEPEARRFSKIFYRLRRDVFGYLHMTAYAYDVLGGYAVAERLGMLKRPGRGLAHRVDALIGAHNALWIELLESAEAMASEGVGEQAVDVFLARARARSAELVLAFKSLSEAIDDAATAPLRSDIVYPKTAAAVALAMSILAGAACSGERGVGLRDAGDTGADTATATDTEDTTDTDTAGGSDSGGDTDALPTDTDVVEDTDTDSASDTEPPACGPDSARREAEHIFEQARRGCGFPCVGDPEGFAFILDGDGRVVDVVLGNGDPVDGALKACYLAAVEGQTFPCLRQGGDIWLSCAVLLC